MDEPGFPSPSLSARAKSKTSLNAGGSLADLVVLDRFSSEILPSRVQELRTSQKNLDQVAAYCRTLYEEPDIPREQYVESLQQTKGYAMQALTSVAYQLNQAAVAVQEYICLQLGEVDDQQNELTSAVQVGVALFCCSHSCLESTYRGRFRFIFYFCSPWPETLASL
jgi:hypothetical protein